MERIIVEVKTSTAKKWRGAPKSKKNRVASMIDKVLDDEEKILVEEPQLGYARPKKADLQKHREKIGATQSEYNLFLKNIRDKASASGLTPEILEQLLREDD